jgi:hypothetical protein
VVSGSLKSLERVSIDVYAKTWALRDWDYPEMVRRVTLDGAPVTATASAFGYSRPSYYQAAAALAASGLDGPGAGQARAPSTQSSSWPG